MSNTTTLNTRIQLRSDTTSNWESSNPFLKKGELGVEFVQIPVYGSDGVEVTSWTDTTEIKIKIGNGTSAWKALPYVGGDGTKTQIFEVNINTDNTKLGSSNPNYQSPDHISNITKVVGTTKLNKGDIAIVKETIVLKDSSGNDATISMQKYQYTAYVYDIINSTGSWKAMDGNYNANNVYFDSDILMAGSYTQVGNLSKTSTGTGNIAARGKSLAELMTSIFTKEELPYKKGTTDYTNNLPKMRLSVSQNANGEVGSTYDTPTATVTIDSVGSYRFTPTATNIEFPVNNVIIAQLSSSTNNVDSTNNISTTKNNKAMVKNDTLTLQAALSSTNSSTTGTYTDDTITYYFDAKGTHTSGQAPKSNIGTQYENNDDNATNQAKWDYRIPANTLNVNNVSSTRRGFRRLFGGGLSSASATITSDDIRGNGSYVTPVVLFREGQTIPNTSTGGDVTNLTSVPGNTSAATNRFVFEVKAGAQKAFFAYPASYAIGKAPVVEILTTSWDDMTETGQFTSFVNVSVEGYNEATAISYKVYTWVNNFQADTRFRVRFN